MSMRIIAGEWKGRSLFFKSHTHLRPTMDRVKESIFNILGGTLEEARGLDLFAGVGSLGIEALSRGVGEMCFVDESRASVDIIRRNLVTLGVPEARYRLVRGEVLRSLRSLIAQGVQFDLVFLDPPYSKGLLLGNTLSLLGESAILRPSSRLVVEHATQEKLVLGPTVGLKLFKEVEFGGTTVSFLLKI